MENYIIVGKSNDWFSGNDNKLMFDVKNKDSHLVYFAYKGDSEASRLLVDLFGVKRSLFDQYVSKVNSTNDVGTFYPQYYVSLMPPESVYLHPPMNAKNNGLHELIIECIKAHELYIKTSMMRFHVEKYNISNPEGFFETVQHACNTYFSDGRRSFLKEVEVCFC
jgi:hypothetical protein